MKAISATLAFSLGLVIEGCVMLSGVEPMDLSQITSRTATEEVEAVLGEPIETVETGWGLAAVYEYHRGWEPPSGAGYGYLIGGMPYLIPVIEYVSQQEAKKQKALLTILYHQDNRSSSAFIGSQIDNLRRAAQGDAEAHYELGKSALQTDDKWRWLCRAAHRGDRQAQFNLSVMYSKDYENFPNDRVQAYMWYSLAAKGCAGTPGYCPNDLGRRFLAKKMTQEQITMVDSLVAEWEPNPAECENEPSHSGP